MIKMTPGPWLVHPRMFCHITTQSGRGIANAGGYSSNMDNGEHIAENEANAKAIAAVPNMIDALMSLRKHLAPQPSPLAKACVLTIDAALKEAGVEPVS